MFLLIASKKSTRRTSSGFEASEVEAAERWIFADLFANATGEGEVHELRHVRKPPTTTTAARV